MIMHFITCPICDEAFKSRGKFADHRQMREHVSKRHPASWRDLQAEEEKFSAEYCRLMRIYGYAVKPIRSL